MQLRTQFSYKMLIEDLHALGYCSAYPEMVKFEKNAAIMTNMVLDQQDNKVTDNADHDTCTLDIKGTFLCMAFIAAVTPCLQNKKIYVPRKHVRLLHGYILFIASQSKTYGLTPTVTFDFWSKVCDVLCPKPLDKKYLKFAWRILIFVKKFRRKK